MYQGEISHNKKYLLDDILTTDSVLTGLKPKIISLIGDSKSGKSTLTSVFAYHPFIIGQSYGQFFYQPTGNINLQANNSLLTCTTFCNRIDFEECSLLDIPAINQNQNKKMIAHYSLRKLFESKKQMKFILVISELKYTSSMAKQRFESFCNFLTVFRNGLEHEELRQKIFKSTRVVITKTLRKKQNLLKILKGSLNFLRGQHCRINMKDQLLHFINFIVENPNIIDIFPQPKNVNQHPIYLSISTDASWQYLDIQQEHQKWGNFWNCDPIDIEKEENQQIGKAMRDRGQFIKNSYQIMKKIIGICISNNNWYKNKINYDEATHQIISLLDYYQYPIKPSEQQIHNFLGNQFTQSKTIISKTGLQAILLLKQINENMLSVIHKNQYCKWLSENNFDELFQHSKRILNHFKDLYCNNRQQHQLFLNFSFYFLTTIISGLNCQQMLGTSDFFMLLIDSFYNILEYNISFAQYSFIKNLTKQRFESLFSTAEQQESYLRYAHNFIQKYSHVNLFISESQQILIQKNIDFRKLVKQHFEIQRIVIINMYKQKKFISIIELLLQSFQIIQSIVLNLKHEIQENENDENKQQMKKFQMIVIANLKAMADIFRAVNQKLLAARIYQHIGFSKSFIGCYEQLIAQTSDTDLQIKYLLYLGDYCLKMENKMIAWNSYYMALEKSIDADQRQMVQLKLEQLPKHVNSTMQNVRYMDVKFPSMLLDQAKQYIRWLYEDQPV